MRKGAKKIPEKLTAWAGVPGGPMLRPFSAGVVLYKTDPRLGVFRLPGKRGSNK